MNISLNQNNDSTERSSSSKTCIRFGGAGIGSMLGAVRLLYGMGRENAIPRKFFGEIDSKRFIPRNNVLFIGATTLIGAFVLNFQLTAEMLNFGAFIAFMGVNLLVFFHFFIKEKKRKFINIVPPLIGFIKTKGFRKNISLSSTTDSEKSV